MKKIALFILIVLQIITINVLGVEDNVSVARSYIVMDVDTGRVLNSYDENIKLPMASTTKIITVLIAIENADLSDIVSISRYASFQEGSSVYLKEGEKIKLEDLLYCVMLRSGNDAAVAVAEHISGSVEAFASLMNRRAKELGAINTNFVNPHGLPDDSHYTTAYDLGLITREALKNDVFAKIVSTKKHIIPKLINGVSVLENKNKMLWQYPNGNGVKTGYTKKAGQCLVTSATKDDLQILSIVLNCSDIWGASTSLLNYGFENFDKVKVIDSRDNKKNIKITKGKKKNIYVIPKEDLYGPLSKTNGRYEKIEYIDDLSDNIIAPVKKDQKAGVLKAYVNGFLLGQTDLLYGEDVDSSDIFYNFKKVMNSFLQ